MKAIIRTHKSKKKNKTIQIRSITNKKTNYHISRIWERKRVGKQKGSYNGGGKASTQ